MPEDVYRTGGPTANYPTSTPDTSVADSVAAQAAALRAHQQQRQQQQQVQQQQANPGNFWDGVKHALTVIGQLGGVSGATGAQTQQHEQNYAANQAPKAKPKSTPAPKKAASPAPKPKPAAQPSSGKQRQIAQYKSEQAAVDREPSLPVGPGVSLSARDVGEMVGDVMDPRTPLRLPGSTKADRMARAQRIASGQENWQPMVGKTAPGDAQKYRNQRRLAEQQERGIFGERLPKAVAHAKVEQALLTVGSAKLKTGEPLSAMEQKALIKAGKIRNPDPAASDDAATIGTLESMAPGLAVGEALAPALRGRVFGSGRLAKAGQAIAGRFSHTGATAEEIDARAGIKPPKGEPIGANVPAGGGGKTVEEVMSAGPKKAAADAERAPLPKAKEAPAKPSRAAATAKKERAAEINKKTEGPGTAPKPKRTPRGDDAKASQLVNRLSSSVQANAEKAKQKFAAFRDTLPANKRTGFDKLTPKQKADYMKFRGESKQRSIEAMEHAVRAVRKKKGKPNTPSTN